MRRTLIAIGLIAALLMATGCARRGGNCPDPGGTIKVGVYGDLSGQTSSFGQSTKNGTQMAADELNAAGGINDRRDRAHRQKSARAAGPAAIRKDAWPSSSGLHLSAPGREAGQSGSGASAHRRSGIFKLNRRRAHSARGESAYDLALFNEPEGDADRRLHLSRMLHRPISG